MGVRASKLVAVVVLALVLAGCAAGEDGTGSEGHARSTITEEDETTSSNAQEETTTLKEGTNASRPPHSTLSYGGHEVRGRIGSFCWTIMCADMAGMPVPGKKQTLPVPSGSKMVFRYRGQTSTYEVRSVNGYPLGKVKEANGNPLDKELRQPQVLTQTSPAH